MNPLLYIQTDKATRVKRKKATRVKRRKEEKKKTSLSLMAKIQEERAAQILIIPYPAQGHMLPLLDLAHLLSRRHGLAVTIAVTPKNLPILSPLLSISSSPSIQPLVLPFPKYPSLPPDAENTKDLPPHLFPFLSFIHAVSYLHDPILSWARSTLNPPHAIICDFFTGWAHKLARELSVPCITYAAFGALSLSIVHRLWHDMPKRGGDDDDNKFSVSFPSVPGSPAFLWYQLPLLYTSYKDGDPLSEFIRECFLDNFKGAGFVINSFDELEGMYLDHLRKVLDHENVWAVGPVNNWPGISTGPGPACGGPSAVTAWLDGCGDESVIYVCFGSQLALSREQAEAVAAGLERSGARFVWCVRAGPAEVIPDGFEERTEDRGAVIRGWAPQVEVLGHRSVGAYFTHCGFNSVQEAISAGVMMLTWPMLADQYMNARLVVEVAGVGISVCEGHGAVPDSDKLARSITAAMAGDCAERARARDLKRKALEAVSNEGGSSCRNLDALVEMLKLNDQVKSREE